MTMITQRSAAINKNVLTQAGTLIAMRTTGPQDVAAVEAWIKYHGAKQDILASLASLECGEAWIYSPQFLKETVRTRFRQRQTYDSGATPKAGTQSRPAATLADVDLGALRSSMASTIEAAKENDPKELKAKIRSLTALLAKAQSAERPDLEQQIADLKMQNAWKQKMLNEAAELSREIARDFNEFQSVMQRFAAVLTVEENQEPSQKLAPSIAAQIGQPRSEPKTAKKEPKPVPDGITGPQSKVLNALAWWKAAGFDSPSKLQIAFVAGYSPGTGAFNNTCGSLRTAGLIEYPSPGCAKLTATGLEAADSPDAPLSLGDFHEFVMEKLTGPQTKVLRVLIERYPSSIAKDELARQSGYSPGTGAFNNTCGSLRSLGLADYPERGTVIASASIFPEGL